jgi:hypothetical protein
MDSLRGRATMRRGRPRKDEKRERAVKSSNRLYKSEQELLRHLGQGNISEGIRRLIEMFKAREQ